MATHGKKLAKTTRARVKLKIRKKISGTSDKPRLSVFRSSKHTYAQLIVDDNQKTLVAASTLEKEVQAIIEKLAAGESADKKSLKSVLAARAVGLVLAERSKASKIGTVVFDRNGFLFTGRVKALADGAREGGLNF